MVLQESGVPAGRLLVAPRQAALVRERTLPKSFGQGRHVFTQTPIGHDLCALTFMA